jgi:hypothetical protein
MTANTMIEIIHVDTGAIVVCDTLGHVIACDDGLAYAADEIMAALARGESYVLGGGAAAGFAICMAPMTAQGFRA